MRKVNKRVSFCCQNTNALPSKPKTSLRHLKLGSQEFHRKFNLALADKAAKMSSLDGSIILTLLSKNLIVHRPMNYNLWLKRGLWLMIIPTIQPPSLLWVFKKPKISFLRFIGCLNITKDHTKHSLLQMQVFLPLLNFLNCWLLVLLLSESMWLNIATRSMKDQVRICFGPLKISNEVLNKLKSRNFRASSLSMYDFLCFTLHS